MTKDQILSMARQADLGRVVGPLTIVEDDEWEIIERFAALVAEHERTARISAQEEVIALKERIAKADVERQQAVMAERQAIINSIPGGSIVDPQWVCDMIRGRSA